jgi:alpha-1,3-mannosyltransferase
MKVVHVVRQYLPSVGGLEEVVRNLAHQQSRGGRYTPTVLTLNRVFRTGGTLLPATETLDGVKVKRLAYTGSERYPLCPQVAGALRGADLVHVHGIEFFFDYLALLHPLMRKPMLASTHGGFFHSGFASRLMKIYFRTVTPLSAKAYQKVIATSENDGQLFGPVVPTGRLQVIENGVDMRKFADAASPELRPVMIYFGRWSVNKGLLECIDVLAALCQQQPEVPWQLMIAGREYDLDAKALQRYAQARGVAGRISLQPNPGVAELRQLIGMASYFLCLSHHEGFGIAPIEAISAGLIPLLSPIPPFVRLFRTTCSGVLLDAPSAALQAGQISALHAQMGDDARRHAVCETAAYAALHAYSWQGVAARYARQYDLALGLS